MYLIPDFLKRQYFLVLLVSMFKGVRYLISPSFFPEADCCKFADFLLKFVNEQGKILPRRLTGTSLKYQRKVSVAVKRARHLALMPYVADLLK